MAEDDGCKRPCPGCGYRVTPVEILASSAPMLSMYGPAMHLGSPMADLSVFQKACGVKHHDIGEEEGREVRRRQSKPLTL